MTKILIVDDNDMLRAVMARRLKRLGYEVSLAVDGEQGVALARSERPDVVLMDMTMPVKDGWTATRELRADRATARLPIIAVTAHVAADAASLPTAAGCDDYVVKPFDFAELLVKIESALPPGSGPASLR